MVKKPILSNNNRKNTKMYNSLNILINFAIENVKGKEKVSIIFFISSIVSVLFSIFLGSNIIFSCFIILISLVSFYIVKKHADEYITLIIAICFQFALTIYSFIYMCIYIDFFENTHVAKILNSWFLFSTIFIVANIILALTGGLYLYIFFLMKDEDYVNLIAREIEDHTSNKFDTD